MIDNNVLDEALKKRDKEIEKFNSKFEEQKKSYEKKIKNLMSSITQLKAEKNELETSSKDNVRVNIINNMKNELKDKEIVINILRKLIGDEEKVDKLILKEFGKQGEFRMPSFEDMKIKIRQLEGEIVTLKHKLNSSFTKTKTEESPDNTDIFLKQIEQLKEDNEKLKSEIVMLNNDNITLKVYISLNQIGKEKLERMYTELFDRIKTTNKELGEMKSVYDDIKRNFREENEMKTKNLNETINNLEKENNKIKQKLVELIEISEKQNRENTEKFKKIHVENEVFKRLIETKNNELKVLEEELKSYEGEFMKEEDKNLTKYKRVEREVIDLRKVILECKERIAMYERLSKDKENEIDNLKSVIKDKDELICEKNDEIELIESKILEMENFLKENRKK